MSDVEVAKLIVALEARVRGYEKALARATGETQKQMAAIEKRTQQASRNISENLAGSLKSFGKGLLAGVVAGGVTGIVAQLGRISAEIASIGDEAKRAGISARAFQEWKFVAEQNRIGIDAMVDGFKELQLRADEFIVTGAGAGAEAFLRLGFNATDLAERLKNPSELMLEIIRRLGDLDRAAQIRIADEVFGGSAGERFVELIAQGEDGLRKTIARANELGVVLDDQVIARAVEVNTRFNEISNTVGMTLKSAIVSATDSLIDFINSFRSFENQRSGALQGQVNTIQRERALLVDELRKLQTGEDLSPVARDLGFGPATEEAKRQIADVQARIDALSAREDELIGILSQRVPDELPKPTDRTWTPAAAPAKRTGGGGGASRSKAVSDIERQRKAVADLIVELERELSLVGASDLERDTSNLLRQAGAEATEDQRAKIVALASALYAEEVAQRRATDAAQEMQDIGRDVLGGMISDLRAGKSAADIFASALDRIADRLINMGLDALFGGGGGGLSWLTSLLRGGASGGPPLKLFARGGFVSGPGTATSDSIPARLSKGEFVVNAAATKRNLGLLQAINSGRATQMLAAGGMVGMSRSVAGLDGGGGATINMKVVNQMPNAEVVPGTDSMGNPTLIVRQVEGALAKRVGTRQSALGRAANVTLRG